MALRFSEGSEDGGNVIADVVGTAASAVGISSLFGGSSGPTKRELLGAKGVTQALVHARGQLGQANLRFRRTGKGAAAVAKQQGRVDSLIALARLARATGQVGATVRTVIRSTGGKVRDVRRAEFSYPAPAPVASVTPPSDVPRAPRTTLPRRPPRAIPQRPGVNDALLMLLKLWLQRRQRAASAGNIRLKIALPGVPPPVGAVVAPGGPPVPFGQQQFSAGSIGGSLASGASDFLSGAVDVLGRIAPSAADIIAQLNLAPPSRLDPSQGVEGRLDLADIGGACQPWKVTESRIVPKSRLHYPTADGVGLHYARIVHDGWRVAGNGKVKGSTGRRHRHSHHTHASRHHHHRRPR